MASPCQTGQPRRKMSTVKNMLYDRVELSISASNLPDADILSKSDPVCHLSVRKLDQPDWKEVGRTEVISNNLNPTFSHKFILDLYYEEKQQIKLDFYDVDSSKRPVSEQEFLGSVEFSLNRLASNEIGTEPLHIPDTQKKKQAEQATVKVVAETLCKETKDEVALAFKGSDLAYGKRCALEIYKKLEVDDSFVLAYRSEVAIKTKNPTWNEIKMPLAQLCNGQRKRELKIVAMDHTDEGKPKPIGECPTTMEELKIAKSRSEEAPLPFINADRKKARGMIFLTKLDVQSVHDFADYVEAGAQIEVYVAIDLTRSNRNPQDPTSNHHYSDVSLPINNHYTRAMEVILSLMENLSNKQFKAYGFGSKNPETEECVDIFPLNDCWERPECEGLYGVLQAYTNVIQQVELYAPSHFQAIIDHVSSEAKSCPAPKGSNYHVLIILTDGDIDDMADTKKLLVEKASASPMSIIVIGIGDKGNFEDMRVLADGKFEFKGKKMDRQIVQFKLLSEYVDGEQNGDKNEALLQHEIKQELGNQFLEYCRLNDIAWIGAGRGSIHV